MSAWLVSMSVATAQHHGALVQDALRFDRYDKRRPTSKLNVFGPADTVQGDEDSLAAIQTVSYLAW
jgi:hypothetical protein